MVSLAVLGAQGGNIGIERLTRRRLTFVEALVVGLVVFADGVHVLVPSLGEGVVGRLGPYKDLYKQPIRILNEIIERGCHVLAGTTTPLDR